MPELPEVQTVVSDLKRKVVGLRIKKIWLGTPKILKFPTFKEFSRKIVGSKIASIIRRGKNIIFFLDSPWKEKLVFLVHLKMTGHFLYGQWRRKRGGWEAVDKKEMSDPVNRYIRAIFYLDNGKQLAFSDLRKFGKFVLGKKEEVEEREKINRLGPEPLVSDFTYSVLKNILLKEKRKIKTILMDQEKIAGIGNIYSDEILWASRLHPSRRGNSLTEKEIKTLFQAIKEVLAKAVKERGTSVSDFRDLAGKPGKYGLLREVYRREGENCGRCGNQIKRVKIGGRSAYFCPKCQKA